MSEITIALDANARVEVSYTADPESVLEVLDTDNSGLTEDVGLPITIFFGDSDTRLGSIGIFCRLNSPESTLTADTLNAS